jgi:hypothetical protein
VGVLREKILPHFLPSYDGSLLDWRDIRFVLETQNVNLLSTVERVQLVMRCLQEVYERLNNLRLSALACYLKFVIAGTGGNNQGVCISAVIFNVVAILQLRPP